MNERIKKLRKVLDLTQQEFADKIGTTRNNIAGYETGRRLPSEAAINLIIAKLNVSETWLRTGEGEMFAKKNREDEITQMVQKLLSGESSDFKARFISVLAGLKEEQWVVLEEKMNEIIGSRTVPPPGPVTPLPSAEPAPVQVQSLAKELENLKHQNQNIIRQNQEMAAEIAAMKEEDDALEQSLLVKKSQFPSP